MPIAFELEQGRKASFPIFLEGEYREGEITAIDFVVLWKLQMLQRSLINIQRQRKIPSFARVHVLLTPVGVSNSIEMKAIA